IQEQDPLHRLFPADTYTLREIPDLAFLCPVPAEIQDSAPGRKGSFPLHSFLDLKFPPPAASARCKIFKLRHVHAKRADRLCPELFRQLQRYIIERVITV